MENIVAGSYQYCLGRHCYAGWAIRWALPCISSLLCCNEKSNI